jgi:ferredoxin
MANKKDKYPQNVRGKYYVDNLCIDCDLCRETAPDNFARNNDGGHSYVCSQPKNEAERVKCRKALQGCPVDAIGSNG